MGHDVSHVSHMVRTLKRRLWRGSGKGTRSSDAAGAPADALAATPVRARRQVNALARRRGGVVRRQGGAVRDPDGEGGGEAEDACPQADGGAGLREEAHGEGGRGAVEEGLHASQAHLRGRAIG